MMLEFDGTRDWVGVDYMTYEVEEFAVLLKYCLVLMLPGPSPFCSSVGLFICSSDIRSGGAWGYVSLGGC